MKDQIICKQRKELDVYRNYANSFQQNPHPRPQSHYTNTTTNCGPRCRSANPITNRSKQPPRQSSTMFQGGSPAGPLRQLTVTKNLENKRLHRDNAHNFGTNTEFPLDNSSSKTDKPDSKITILAPKPIKTFNSQATGSPLAAILGKSIFSQDPKTQNANLTDILKCLEGLLGDGGRIEAPHRKIDVRMSKNLFLDAFELGEKFGEIPLIEPFFCYFEDILESREAFTEY
jgi:hypothetical protein